jgi:hypothetical protein
MQVNDRVKQSTGPADTHTEQQKNQWLIFTKLQTLMQKSRSFIQAAPGADGSIGYAGAFFFNPTVIFGVFIHSHSTISGSIKSRERPSSFFFQISSIPIPLHLLTLLSLKNEAIKTASFSFCLFP